MPSWVEVLREVQSIQAELTNERAGVFDSVRRRYLSQLAEVTDRNVIAYYSGWLQRDDLRNQGVSGFEVNDQDMAGFMATVHELDKSRGLDLVLHTPVGQQAATESIVNYLRSMFDGDIRAIIPQLAMSAGTMMACACRSVVMGKHSSLGPIDPQFSGTAARDIVDEFRTAQKEVAEDPSSLPLWAAILRNYSPALVTRCRNQVALTRDMVMDWLVNGMLAGESEDPRGQAAAIVEELTTGQYARSHNTHVSADAARSLGLNVESLEAQPRLQDAVLSVHHAYIITFSAKPIVKIIENHQAKAFIIQAKAGPASR